MQWRALGVQNCNGRTIFKRNRVLFLNVNDAKKETLSFVEKVRVKVVVKQSVTLIRYRHCLVSCYTMKNVDKCVIFAKCRVFVFSLNLFFSRYRYRYLQYVANLSFLIENFTILKETISSKIFHRRYLRVINGITEFMPACSTTTYLSSLGWLTGRQRSSVKQLMCQQSLLVSALSMARTAWQVTLWQQLTAQARQSAVGGAWDTVTPDWLRPAGTKEDSGVSGRGHPPSSSRDGRSWTEIKLFTVHNCTVLS